MTQPNERLLPVIDECDSGHKFAKLPGHPMRDGLARCPHCMAQGLDAAKVPAVQEEGMVEAVARAICTAGTEEPGLCFRDDDPHEEKCIRSCVGCRNVARAAIQAMSLYGETTSSESSS